MTQVMKEEGIGLCAVAEPTRRLNPEKWCWSLDGLAAIYWNSRILGRSGTVIGRGDGYVSAELGDFILVSVYISPNSSQEEFLEFLDNLGEEVRRVGGKRIIICGDFNAKSVTWGSPKTNKRGEFVEVWAAESDMRLINTGLEPTCVRAQGESYIDLTWASPDLMERIKNWQVLQHETLSDHAYIHMEIDDPKKTEKQTARIRLGWNWRKVNLDLFRASLIWKCATLGEEENSASVLTEMMREALKDACDIAAPRRKPQSARKECHWWSDRIVELRGVATHRRRRWKRKRRSARANPEELNELESEYREAKKELRKAIRQAKVESWKDLTATIEKDPWGLPYRVVLRKLRSATPGLTEQLEEDQVHMLLQSLFPKRRTEEEELTSDQSDDEESLEIERDKKVTSMEVLRVIKRSGAGNTAPGPDGITTKIMRCIPNETCELAAKAFSACLTDCYFPLQWKKADLVLIPKIGNTAEGLPKCRPICLISEVGKILERLIADRMKRWMADNPQHQLSENQFGFREGRSTCDALAVVKDRIVRERADGGVTVAVSLDIENAFNSIPWWRIMEAMKEKEFPSYLRRLIRNYLGSRWVEYPIKGGGRGTMTVEAGVPQGSVLGPLLWNIAFDAVVGERVEVGCGVICYADDTLILASADTANRAISRASLQTGLVLNKIRRMGLRVAVHKTEVVMFDSSKSRKTQEEEEEEEEEEIATHIQVGDARIKIAKSMKYLGVVLDKGFTFKDHFQMIEKKAVNVSRALCRVMPNLRGPTEAKRRLYIETVKSVILYGAPIWSEELQRSGSSMRALNRVMRTLALRAISAYRSVSLDAALLLARIPPLYLLAKERKRV